MLKAIVFDFDGVIVDSEPLHYQAFLALARGFGLDFTYEEYARKYIGYDDRDAFRAMLVELDGSHVDEDRLAELGRKKSDVFQSIADAGVRAYPGVLDLIHRAAAVMPLAIASGATRKDLELVLGKFGLGDRFEPIVSADDVAHSKPDPQTYVLAVRGLARRHRGLAIQPVDCLAIEDTAAGIDSARAAGLRTLGVAHTGPASQIGHADQVVAALADLDLETLRGWYS